jgi:hypothetical protein
MTDRISFPKKLNVAIKWVLAVRAAKYGDYHSAKKWLDRIEQVKKENISILVDLLQARVSYKLGDKNSAKKFSGAVINKLNKKIKKGLDEKIDDKNKNDSYLMYYACLIYTKTTNNNKEVIDRIIYLYNEMNKDLVHKKMFRRFPMAEILE